MLVSDFQPMWVLPSQGHLKKEYEHSRLKDVIETGGQGWTKSDNRVGINEGTVDG